MAKALALLALSQMGIAQEVVNGGRVFWGRLQSTGAQASVDFTGAASTSPVKAGTLAGRPSACTVGQIYFATDATAGQNLAVCTAANIWTTISGGSGVSAQTGTSYTFQDSDCSKLVTFSNAAAITASLPQAGASSWFKAGWVVDVQNRGAGNVTIVPASSTIDGAASLMLTQNQGARIFSDGTNYFTERGVGSAGGTAPATTNFLAGDGSGGISNSQVSTVTSYSSLRAGATQWKALGLGFGLTYASPALTDFQAAATTQSIKLGTAASLWSMIGGRLEETATVVSAASNITAVNACLGPVTTPCALTPGGLPLLSGTGQFAVFGPGSGAASATASQDIYLTLTVTNANPGNLGVSGLSVSGCTNTNPAVCTVAGHGFKSGSTPTVTIGGATGSWSVLNGTYQVAYTSPNTLTMNGVNGIGIGSLTGTVTLSGSYLQAGTVTSRIWGDIAQ